MDDYMCLLPTARSLARPNLFLRPSVTRSTLLHRARICQVHRRSLARRSAPRARSGGHAEGAHQIRAEIFGGRQSKAGLAAFAGPLASDGLKKRPWRHSRARDIIFGATAAPVVRHRGAEAAGAFGRGVTYIGGPPPACTVANRRAGSPPTSRRRATDVCRGPTRNDQASVCPVRMISMVKTAILGVIRFHLS